MRIVHCGRFRLVLDRPLVMGIVNVTPDSFSECGAFSDTHAVIEHALRLIDEGADLLDIGGESSRPAAEPVSLQMELDRVLPVVEALRDAPIPISVDTGKAGVMRQSIACGASMINDITALRDAQALELLRTADVAVCLMHMRGEPRSMQIDPHYEDVVEEVGTYLDARVAAARSAGVAAERMVIDPGFGFGKTLQHNLQLLRALKRLRPVGYPVLAGLSRKHMLGLLSGRPVAERVHASIAAAIAAVANGASIVRVHDVAATVDALTVWAAAFPTNAT